LDDIWKCDDELDSLAMMRRFASGGPSYIQVASTGLRGRCKSIAVGLRRKPHPNGSSHFRRRAVVGSDPPLTVNITDSICAVGTLDWLGVTVGKKRTMSVEANATRSVSVGLKQKRDAKKAA
jgi:hypothetical protein